MDSIAGRLELARPELGKRFEAHGVQLAYVFGSVVEGREHPDSDLDFAVRLDPTIRRNPFADIELALNTEIIGLVHTSDVDVVIANEAPPLLAFEVATKGGRIFGTKEPDVDFKVHAANRDYETEPFRRIVSETVH